LLVLLWVGRFALDGWVFFPLLWVRLYNWAGRINVKSRPVILFDSFSNWKLSRSFGFFVYVLCVLCYWLQLSSTLDWRGNENESVALMHHLV
jgi:hypothetical protein